ncbi:hypothetical protein AADZ91_07955 [Colwelliaceae bacterium 6441]
MRPRNAYFVISGIIAHFSIIVVLILVAKYFDLSPRQLVFRIMEKTGVESAVVGDIALNRSFITRYLEATATPILKQSRTFLPQIDQLGANQLDTRLLERSEFKNYDPCLFSGIFWDLACFLVTNDSSLSNSIINSTIQFKLNTPNATGHYGNGWHLAFIYSSINQRLKFSNDEKQAINKQLRQAIRHYLLLLNDNSASMWHGRASLIAEMWLCVLALDNPTEIELKDTAPHFYSLVQAMELTESWPEGYNYWINSRAYQISLALSGYMQGTQPDKWHPRIYKVLNKIGLWHIYATRPDNKVEPLGDEGPRLDLKDETRRVIDIIAQTTENPVFSEYSNQLERLHGRESYYRGYRWGFSLFNQWHTPLPESFISYIDQLPKSEIFGLPYFGQAYIRQSWQDDASFMSFRSGSSFTHHGHYDSGHISLFKGSPLLVNSSQYQGFMKNNRLDYSIRTIAKNSVIVSTERGAEIDGGQRVTLPKGSAVLSPKHWLNNRNKGQNLIGGEIKYFQNVESYTYIKADLTKAYHSDWLASSDKASSIKTVARDILYLRELDVLIVKDNVHTGSENQQAKLVYHTMNKPNVSNESVISGHKTNGIITTNDNVLLIENGQGNLVTEVFGDVENIRLVGGKDYQFYLDSDQSNKTEGLSVNTLASAPLWRFEIQLPKVSHPQNVITIHRPSIGEATKKRTKIYTYDENRYWLQLDHTAVFFGEVEDQLLQTIGSQISTIYQCGITNTKMKGCAVIVRGQL